MPSHKSQQALFALPRCFPCVSPAIFLYFSDCNKLKLIYTLAWPAKASWCGGASWSMELQECLPRPSLPCLSLAKKRSTECPGCQRDPSAPSKEKGNKPEQIPALQLEGRARWLWQCCQLPLQCNTCIFGLFSPSLRSSMITAYSIRKESTTQRSADPQDRAGLSSEVSPHGLRYS